MLCACISNVSLFALSIKGLQDENDKLQRGIQHVELELKEATSAMNTMADENGKLKVLLHCDCYSKLPSRNLQYGSI